MAFAKANNLDELGMVKLAIKFATAPEDLGPDMKCAEEEEIVRYAAKLLTRADK